MHGTTTEHPVEVRVYQCGLLRLCAWCGSEDEATEAIEMWKALGGVRCELVR